MTPIDATHDPALQSWVEPANTAGTDFPIQNLPFGRFRDHGTDWRIGVAVGDQGLELSAGDRQPVVLPNGERRSILADGDTLILAGHCERAGVRHIGFGLCSGTVLGV